MATNATKFALPANQTHITPMNLLEGKKDPDYMKFLKESGLPLASMAEAMVGMGHYGINW